MESFLKTTFSEILATYTNMLDSKSKEIKVENQRMLADII